MSSSAAVKHQGLICTVYRGLLRYAKVFDAKPATKAVIPFPLPFALQLLMGGRNRDFYAHNASVCEAVRAGFREPLHPQTELSDELRVDLAIQLQKDMSQWLHLLLAHGRPLPPLPLEGEALSFEGRYADARRADASLDRALGLLEEAQQQLKDGAERAEVIRLYEESMRVQPTADACTYLAYTREAYEGRFEEAVGACKRAIDLDPGFGNAYNDLGLYLWQLQRPAEAVGWLEASKRKPRYDERHKPFLNLGHLYLEQGEPHKALFEYIHALHHAGPERGKEIRAVVLDMVRCLGEEEPVGPSGGGP